MQLNWGEGMANDSIFDPAQLPGLRTCSGSLSVWEPQNTTPEWANTEGTRVGADFAAQIRTRIPTESGADFVPETGADFLWNCSALFLCSNKKPRQFHATQEPQSTSILDTCSQ